MRRLVAVWERRDHALQAVAGLRGPAVLFLEQLDGAPARERLDKGDARVEFLQPEARQGDLEEITKLGLALPGQLVERPTRPLAAQTPSPVPIGQVGSVDTSRQDVALAPGYALRPVVAPLRAAHQGGLDDLAVDEGRAGVPVAPFPFAYRRAKPIVGSP